jgi:hypothetical protein
MKMKKIIVTMILAGSLYALDTTEPYNLGFSDIELTGSYCGCGLERNERTLGWEGLIGVGITERFSVSAIYAMESDDYLVTRDNEFVFELFYTAVETEQFDVDVFGNTGTGGGYGLGLELNLDFPSFGFQLAAEEGMENKETPDDELLFTTVLAPLAFYNLSESMQLLAGIDFSIAHNALQGEKSFTVGSAALGYNIGLLDALEWLVHVGVNIPQDDEDVSFGFALQFIATLHAGSGR